MKSELGAFAGRKDFSLTRVGERDEMMEILKNMNQDIFAGFVRHSFFAVVLGFLGLLAVPLQAQTALQSAVPVTGLSGIKGSKTYFMISVPAGQTRLDIQLSAAGGTGDCDLYVKQGTQPTLTSWTYRPYRPDSNETVTVTNPVAGDWFILLNGYTAYSGLTLVATVTGSGGTVAVPTLSPGSGTYAAEVLVSMATGTTGAMIRFTTDGSDPTELSTVYSAPLMLSATTTVKARGYKSGLTPSGVATGMYTVTPGNAGDLVNGVEKTNLSGALNSEAFYKIFVPAGQTSLVIRISTTNGAGDCDLYVKQGAQPTLGSFDYRPYLDGSNETVTVTNPAAGDWYVMLQGYVAFDGVTLSATYSGSANLLPDLVPVTTGLNAYTSTESFTAGACDAVEGLVATGRRRLLRFTTETRNIGQADLVLRSPVNNPLFTYAPCHGHYHFNNFALYRLLNAAGQSVAVGQKVGFCLEDVTRWNPAANSRPQYNCDYQGIQVGWSDIYGGNLPGQWIDITGLAAGTYVLEITMDTANQIAESNEANNQTKVQVVIRAKDGRVTSTPLP